MLTSLSTDSGIYEIRNTLNNRIYIGQTKNFSNRCRKGYQNLLPINKCHNEFLQHDFNKCKHLLGHENFLEFSILEVLNNSTKEYKNIREEWWINQKKEEGKELYNINLFPTKERLINSRNLEETNIRRSKALKGKFLSEEHKKKLSLAKKGKPSSRKGTCWTPEFREKMLPIRQKQPKNLIGPPVRYGMEHYKAKIYDNLNLVSPNGELVTRIECLATFCRDNGLQTSNFHHLINGKIKSHKGWTTKVFGKLVLVEP